MKSILLIGAAALTAHAQLRFALHTEPKTQDPFLMADDAAQAVLYLTEGTLIRVNRVTQKPEPALASSWRISKDGMHVTFELRSGVEFPDGSPFSSNDVVESFRRLLDPALHSPIADTFQTDRGTVKVSARGPSTVEADFPAPASGIEQKFDQVAIVSAKVATRPAPGLGPFLVAERRPGVSILLKRNPAYWNKPLPVLESIRIDIETNRDLELLRFRRGELHLIDSLTPDLFERLSSEDAGSAVDLGPTLDAEFLWFNQSKRAPIKDSTRSWFESAAFRRAISLAIERADLCRVVYRGHATPAAGPVSSANKLWFDASLTPDAFDPGAALKLLASDGFRLQNNVLRDRQGNAVEFSVITNTGSKTRERMAAMIAQDLEKVGIKLNIVTLDFSSLIERITRNLNYEACLLGLVNVDADPSDLMNVLLSSASNHPWNPAQKSPETAWEAEIDRLMLAQAATADYRTRKKDFDRVQAILREQMPVIYLLHPNALSAISRQVSGAKPAAFYPHTFWNAESIAVKTKGAGD